MTKLNSDIVFEPWLGDRYAAGINGKRVVILGESHYHSCEKDDGCKNPDLREKRHRDLTRSMVSHWKDHPHSSPVATRVPALFDMSKSEFWERVGFYNYLQGFAGASARQRPQEEQWSDLVSQRAFQHMLDDLRPERILVLGKSTWSWLPSATDFLVDAPVPESRLSIAKVFGEAPQIDRTAYWYSWQPKGRALAFPVIHPSGFGFSPQEWKADIQNWLDFDRA